jgi:hypothetical protein
VLVYCGMDSMELRAAGCIRILHSVLCIMYYVLVLVLVLTLIAGAVCVIETCCLSKKRMLQQQTQLS